MKWFSLTLVLCVCSASLGFCEEPGSVSQRGDEQQAALNIADLDASMDGKNVTVRITVAKLEGVAQLGKQGQSPTFIVETEPEAQTGNRLTVWIRGDLTNVLHHLQMAFLQENQLKSGTRIEVTGKLTVHTMDAQSFMIDVNRWQDFRILPTIGTDTVTQNISR